MISQLHRGSVRPSGAAPTSYGRPGAVAKYAQRGSNIGSRDLGPIQICSILKDARSFVRNNRSYHDPRGIATVKPTNKGDAFSNPATLVGPTSSLVRTYRASQAGPQLSAGPAVTASGRTGGPWPRRRATAPRTRWNACSTRPAGTPTRSVTTCTATYPSTTATGRGVDH